MESPRTLEALTNDLVVEIFLRIGSPADLVRASAACVAFCRLIANPSFLRRTEFTSRFGASSNPFCWCGVELGDGTGPHVDVAHLQHCPMLSS
uniref:F-box domain-containing protein n=1 Tax=Zea mays TaxID=4577 RepID=A0A804PGK8_MAIZE